MNTQGFVDILTPQESEFGRREATRYLDALNELKMAYPNITAKRRRELKSIRKRL